MNRMHSRLLRAAMLAAVCCCVGLKHSEAQVSGLVVADTPGSSQPGKEDSWLIEQRDGQIRTLEMTIWPKSEPRPALRYRILPDDFDMLDGNAALYYLKAMGFFEQGAARRRLDQFREEALARVQEEDKEYSEVPPAVWLSTPPDQLPLDEVKEYLSLMSFQTWFLREAARRDRFDMDRNLREVDDLLSYLLPEIQSLRELARTQSLRCRVAIAEGRIDDAIEITGQQFALARHLGQDDFLVSNLVGIAIAGIAWNDALYLVQHPKTPNLYWALATMPRPLVDLRHAMATERQWVYEQLKVLREVDGTPRPPGYWQDFVDRLLPQIGYFASEFDLPGFEEEPELVRAAMVAYVAAAYPGAKEYLIKECRMPVEQVDAYPTAQVVFLAMVRFYDQWRDEYFKWMYTPFHQARTDTGNRRVDSEFRAASRRYGWCTQPARLLLPAARAARTAEARCDQTIALLQTVEAVRMYAAANDGRLPPSLDELPVPAPLEPFTGRPVEYEFSGDHAILSGHPLPGMQYRLVLRLAEE